jgi:hypothetical protein
MDTHWNDERIAILGTERADDIFFSVRVGKPDPERDIEELRDVETGSVGTITNWLKVYSPNQVSSYTIERISEKIRWTIPRYAPIDRNECWRLSITLLEERALVYAESEGKPPLLLAVLKDALLPVRLS